MRILCARRLTETMVSSIRERAKLLRIKIDYIAQARVAAGTNSEVCSVAEDCTLAKLVAGLVRTHGSGLATLLLDPEGMLRTSILIAVNDVQVSPEAPLRLRDEDAITIMAPMSGG